MGSITPGVHEVHLHSLGNDSGFVPAVQQFLHRLAASRPVIHGPLVHVHADERIGALVPDPPAPEASSVGGPPPPWGPEKVLWGL